MLQRGRGVEASLWLQRVRLILAVVVLVEAVESLPNERGVGELSSVLHSHRCEKELRGELGLRVSL